MKYKIVLLKRARKYIEKQTPKMQEKILKAIYNLPNGDIKMLKSHKDVFRLRIDNVRVIYTVNHDIVTITVIDAGSRGQIYNNY